MLSIILLEKELKVFILRIAVPSHVRQCFDYLLPAEIDQADITVGMRVLIPFRNHKLVGVIVEIANTSTYPVSRLKKIISVLDKEPIIDSHLLTLCKWLSEYYQHPWGEVIFTCLPQLIRKGKLPKSIDLSNIPSINKQHTASKQLSLNPEQQTAVDTVLQNINFYKTFLLDGVTGSGKTEVYLQIIDHVIRLQKQVMILIPEISLTPQTLQRFQVRFANYTIVSFHSALTDTERLNAWSFAKEGVADIILGTRSAIFSPTKNLGLIIVDEEHDLSFKQQSGLRYSARDVAIMRAHMLNIPIILGSATPSLETLHNSWRNKFQHLHLPNRAGNAQMPKFQILDIRNQSLQAGLSGALINSMQQHLAQGNQVLLFLNRRGFAPVLMCHNCAWLAQCHRCDARMTLHQHAAKLICHHCAHQTTIPTICPQCNNPNLITAGIGTERLESTLQKIFPDYGTIRIDRDTTKRKNALSELLMQIDKKQKHILLGTQMLAKGHHFPNVTLVAIVDADSGFYSSDFRACERLGQLLVQVAGRAGREDKPGTVIVQTHFPDNPLLQTLIKQGYHQFIHELAQQRLLTNLPPYAHLALIKAQAFDKQTPLQFLEQTKQIADSLKNMNINILGPIPATMEKKAGRFHAQILLTAAERQQLQQFLPDFISHLETIPSKNKVKWSIDVDPLEVF